MEMRKIDVAKIEAAVRGLSNLKPTKSTQKITVETTVKASIADAWRAYTTPADIKRWNAASDDWHTTTAKVDLRVGGEFSSRMEAKDGSMGFDFTGTYTKLVEHKLIEYSFGDRTAQIEFGPVENAVSVRVTFDVRVGDAFGRTARHTLQSHHMPLCGAERAGAKACIVGHC